MYVIQSGSKFVKFNNYYPSLSLTATPKTYKTRDAAKADLAKVSELLERDAARAREAIENSTKVIDLAQHELVKHRAKLESLMDLPYRQVHKQVEVIDRAIERAISKVNGETTSLRSFKQDLSRYERMRKDGLSVAMLLPQVNV